jgi:hypothetical protein
MAENCIGTFIENYSVDTRITVCKITEHKGQIPHFDGMIQDELLKVQFLDFVHSVCPQCTEAITVINSTEMGKGIVRVSCADLYKEASFSSGIVTQAFLGTIVSIIDAKSDWLFIQLPDGYLGWVNETVVIADKKKIELWSNPGNLLFINVPYTVVFDPESIVEYVCDVSMGNVLLNHGLTGSFYNVEFPDCRKGIVAVDTAVPFAEWKKRNVLTRENVVAVAKRLMGIPYVWGGCSSRGLDCSGLTKLTYLMNGYVLPRDADQQAKIGITVAYDESYTSLQPGDLLFFGRRADGSANKRDDDPVPISHVGLSLGSALYMQASGDVHKSSLDLSSSIFDKRRSESLQMVKRIIQ